MVLTLALGIGANTAVFSLVRGVLLRPLPYVGGERLVVLYQGSAQHPEEGVPFSIRELLDYRQRTRSFSALVEYHAMNFTLLGRDEPERVATGVVSAEFFQVLGVEPLLGRVFRPEDDAPGAEAVLVLSYPYWQRSFGGDPEVVGRVFEMNNRPHRVVGVLPRVPQWPEDRDVYMPTSACPFRARGEQAMAENRNAFRNLTVFGRLALGVTFGQARDDLDRVGRWLETTFPELYRSRGGYAIGATPLREKLSAQARPRLLALFATTGLVLVIACANVAGLALARTTRRHRELAVRASLGAGRGGLLRLLVVESTLLATAGGLLGLLVARLGLHALVAFASRYTPRAAGVGLDGWVLAFDLLASLLVGLVVGGLPALRGPVEPAGALRGDDARLGGGGAPRLRGALVSVQVALSVVLLVAAALTLRSLWLLQHRDPGFRTDHVLTAEIPLNWSRFNRSDQVVAFLDRVLDRIRNLPGVTSAALSSTVPLGGGQHPMMHGFQVEGRPSEEAAPRAEMRIVGPGFFRTLDIALLRGRVFTVSDDATTTPVAVLDHSLARHYWGDRNPVGSRVSWDDGSSWATVVGVVADVRHHGLEAEPGDVVYAPVAQLGWADSLILRTRGDPARLAREVKAAIHAVGPEQPVTSIHTLTELRHGAVASPRLTALLLGLFGALALAVTVSGLGGLVAYSVARRTREIGVRRALGAPGSKILSLVLGHVLALVAGGLLVGLLGSLAAGRVWSSLVSGPSRLGPGTFAAVAGVLLLAAGLACVLPASRALRVDPREALRTE